MDDQNNEQQLMNAENNEQQLATDQETAIEQQVEKGVEALGDAAKEQGKQAAAEGGKAVGKATISLIRTIIAAIAPFAGILLVVIAVILVIVGIVNVISDLFNGSNESGITDTRAYITSDANGILLSSDNDIIAIMKDLLKAQGMKIEQLGLGDEEQATQYLLKFYKSTIATQLPYIPGVEKLSDKYIQGIVHIKRTATTVEDARDLTWMGYEQFKQNVDSGNSDILNYYAIDENWNLCVATYVEAKTNGVTDSYTLTENKIPYQYLISQYSVPLRYIMVMQQITQNPEYISKMCDMFVEGKQIDYVVFDSIQTTTTTNTYTYYELTRKEVEKTSYDSWDTEKQFPYTVYVMKESKSDEPIVETTISTTITNTITTNVTYAKTWLLELKNNYTNENTTTYPLGEDGQTTEMEDEDGADGDDEGSWRVDQSTNVKQQVDQNVWTKSGSEETQINESEFLGMWSNETGEYSLGAEFKSEKEGGELVQYKIPNYRQKASPVPKILNNCQFIFKLLEDDETTQNYSTIMRYLLYKYTGKDIYGVTELDLNIFASSEFSGVTSLYGNSTAEKLWFALIDAGYSEYAAAGALGNIEHESGIRTNNLQNSCEARLGSDEVYTAKIDNDQYTEAEFDSDSAGYGLCQWTSSGRKKGLYRYAKAKGVSIADEQIQINYFLAEISGQGEGATYISGRRVSGSISNEGITSTHDDWKNASNVEDATLYFMRFFESPASKSSLSDRTIAAMKYYNEFSGKSKPTLDIGADTTTKGVICPRYYQSDPLWKNMPYNYKAGGTISSGGCGACALAMSVSGLTGQMVTPADIVQYLNSIGRETVNNGSGSAQAVANKYGLTYQYINRSDKASIDAALDAGKCLIFSIKSNGIYTGGGHFIMCYGREGDNYYVIESGRYYITDRGYSFNQVFTAGSQGIFALGR